MALLSGTLMGSSLLDLVGITTSKPGPRVAVRGMQQLATAVGVDLAIQGEAQAAPLPVDRPGGAGLAPRVSAMVQLLEAEATSGASADRHAMAATNDASPAMLQGQRDVLLHAQQGQLQAASATADATIALRSPAATAEQQAAPVDRAAAAAVPAAAISHLVEMRAAIESGAMVTAGELRQASTIVAAAVVAGSSLSRSWLALAGQRRPIWQIARVAELRQLVMRSVFRAAIAGGVRVDRNAIAISNSLVGAEIVAGTDVSSSPLASLVNHSAFRWQIERSAAWSPLAGDLEIVPSYVAVLRPITWTPLSATMAQRAEITSGAALSPRLAAFGNVWQAARRVGSPIALGPLTGSSAVHLELAAGGTVRLANYLELARSGILAVDVGRVAQLQLAAAVHFQEQLLTLGPQLERRSLVLTAAVGRTTPHFGVSPIPVAIRGACSTRSTARSGGKISSRPLGQLVSRQLGQFGVGREQIVQPIAGSFDAAAPIWRFGISPPTHCQALEYFTRSAARSGSRILPPPLAQLVSGSRGNFDAGWGRFVAPLAYSSTAAQPIFRFGLTTQATQQFQAIQLAKAKIGPLLIAPPDLYYAIADDLIGYELLDRFAWYQLPSDLVSYELLDRFGLYELPADLFQFELLDRFPWYRLPKE